MIESKKKQEDGELFPVCEPSNLSIQFELK